MGRADPGTVFLPAQARKRHLRDPRKVRDGRGVRLIPGKAGPRVIAPQSSASTVMRRRRSASEGVSWQDTDSIQVFRTEAS
jgi:hypothetical protein